MCLTGGPNHHRAVRRDFPARDGAGDGRCGAGKQCEPAGDRVRQGAQPVEDNGGHCAGDSADGWVQGVLPGLHREFDGLRAELGHVVGVLPSVPGRAAEGVSAVGLASGGAVRGGKFRGFYDYGYHEPAGHCAGPAAGATARLDAGRVP
uniref:(northern house mosquito) hypothetical protein n=1 Tax=Culex pipiens TaxID=7175 RepID=A0A8D8BDN4_CULPI